MATFQPNQADWDESRGRTTMSHPAIYQASALYDAALLRARLAHMWSALNRRPHHLLHLASVQSANPAHASHQSGARAVAIDHIQGSEGRSDEFDLEFRPLRAHTRQRWLSVARAQLSGRELPPVELVQVGNSYFVRDGHHRISVARALGQRFIDARVTVLEADLPVLCVASALSVYALCQPA